MSPGHGRQSVALLRVGVACVALLLSAGCATAPPPVVVKDIDFKAELARQGDWVVLAPYGRVWHPKTAIVGPTFVPYLTGGGWVHGPTGWTFESMWPWGKYTFHYGRWFVADDLGWLWWPDQAWSAAWVQWRAGDGHVGWSPLAPEMRSAHTLPPAWFYLKMKHLSARDAETFLLSPDAALNAQRVARPLPATGPDAEQVRAAGGMERDPVLANSIPAMLEAPPVEAEVEAEPPPPPPKKKKRKRDKRR